MKFNLLDFIFNRIKESDIDNQIDESHSTEAPFQIDEFYFDLQKETGQVKYLQPDEINNPFPGFRPFKTSEWQLFKGREKIVEILLRKLKENQFLFVTGSSGSGKSSLVRAGLIPSILGGYLDQRSNWQIAIFRPGAAVIENLGVAISYLKAQKKDLNEIEKEFENEIFINSLK